MPRPSGQSDFVIDREAVPAPDGAGEATETQTRWVMWFTIGVLIVLVLLVVIGPHIPAGE